MRRRETPAEWLSLTLLEAEDIAGRLARVGGPHQVTASTCTGDPECQTERGCIEEPLCWRCRGPLLEALVWRVHLTRGYEVTFELCRGCASWVEPAIAGGGARG